MNRDEVGVSGCTVLWSGCDESIQDCKRESRAENACESSAGGRDNQRMHPGHGPTLRRMAQTGKAPHMINT